MTLAAKDQPDDVNDSLAYTNINDDSGTGLKKELTPDRSKLLTMEEAVERLHISTPTIYTRMRQGFLHPVRLGRRIYFQPTEVDEEFERVQAARKYQLTPGRRPGLSTSELTPSMKRTLKAQQAAIAQAKKADTPYLMPRVARPNPSVDNYKGDVAASVTKLFNKGLGVREAVVECQITYELAKHLHEEWKTAGPELHLTPKQVAQLQVRFDWWERPTAEGFIAAMNRYLQREIDRTSEEIARGMNKAGDAEVNAPAPATASTPAAASAPAASEPSEPSEAERLALEAEFKRLEEEDKE
jgi:predicted DNA-binding transcriptional regulator AlpA